MAEITILDQATINQIAAGEVIERPSSVAKELLENAIDAGATAITVEIKGGGIDFLRITDNGCGILPKEIPLAFLRHATSKIRNAQDLLTVSSLGFRGEALSSIAAVSQVELITKTEDNLTGVRYRIEGGKEQAMEEVGAPTGTTFLVRNLFFNTPARRKFLKSPQTEGAYISSLVERIALSHPEISFRLIVNGKSVLHTSGNGRIQDLIYTIYGREIAAQVVSVDSQGEIMGIHGFVGKPLISRGNRSYENYFINGRYIKSNLVQRAIEEAYHGLVMQHKYPFTVLHLTLDPAYLDVNVHPTKMELRFREEATLYEQIRGTLRQALLGIELIPRVAPGKMESREISKKSEGDIGEKKRERGPEPYEQKRREKREERPFVHEPTSFDLFRQSLRETPAYFVASLPPKSEEKNICSDHEHQKETISSPVQTYCQDSFLDGEGILTPKARKDYRFIGQLFDTYWLVQYRDQFLMIDQHAAHEKVLFEQTMKAQKEKQVTCQQINPPILLTLNAMEEQTLKTHLNQFLALGFEIEFFGGKEYAVYGVPGNMFSLAGEEILLELLDDLSGEAPRGSGLLVEERVAMMSCKAAVKGNQRLSISEAEELIDELMQLEQPYTCPHGRPTMISMSQYEVEKKFRRVVT